MTFCYYCFASRKSLDDFHDVIYHYYEAAGVIQSDSTILAKTYSNFKLVVITTGLGRCQDCLSMIKGTLSLFLRTDYSDGLPFMSTFQLNYVGVQADHRLYYL